MAKVGIFYASAGGSTTLVAEALKEAYALGDDDCILMEDDFDSVEQFDNYDALFIGSSTWGQGDVHFSWVDPLFEITSENISFAGKKVAFFGAGDSKTHGEHFCSALGKFNQIFTKAGANVIGFVDKEDYTYTASLAEVGDKLCGLAIDTINEKEKTSERIENWIEQLHRELS